MIAMKEMKVESFSKEAFELFSDVEWNNLLRRRGFDGTKKITYHPTSIGVVVKQWDLPA